MNTWNETHRFTLIDKTAAEVANEIREEWKEAMINEEV